MESSNPTLNSKVFDNARAVVGSGQTMTVQGTVNKALILLLVLMATAFWAWAKAVNPASAGWAGTVMVAGLFVGFVLAMATCFKPQWSSVSAPLYAACEGLVLGVLSAYFERSYPGIVVQAVGLTFGVMLAMLMGYKTG
ncbi:MAG TPA: Bax inhibitor-1/YccA family protein, partial [Candidatus Omnitrophota bacterium]|nr:Bax inhibitor-1/YccA family protein [Candidatus Omnitrophota bacterium]